MINYLFILVSYLLLTFGLALRHFEQSHYGPETTTIQQKMIKIKQLKLLLEDPDVNSLLKINPQVYSNKTILILQSSLTQEQTTVIIQAKNLLSKWEECTTEKPYFDGLICVACSTQEIFDLNTQKCARCKSGEIYDSNEKACVSKSTKFSLALTQMDPERAQQIIIIRANQIAANLMSFVVEKTQRLEERLQFDQFTSENKTALTPNVTNPHFLNLILLGEDQSIKQFEQKKNDIACPKQKPFYNDRECISCTYPTHLFDAKTKWCVKCSNNFIYSFKNHKCVELKKGNPTSND